MPTIRCAHCGAEFSAEDGRLDASGRCPKCQALLPAARGGGSPGGEQQDAGGNGAQAGPPEAQGPAGGPEGAGLGDDIEVKPGDVLGGFRVEELIGRGGMGVVCRGTQLSLNRHVALKILPAKYAQNAAFVRQFDSETAALAALNHPNIVSIIDRGHEGETYFFAMEYVKGTNLLHVLRSGLVDAKTCAIMFRQVGDALKYAHGKGVIHRDIKPGNIMLDEQGNVKITDFGLAGIVALAEQHRDGKRRVIGTQGYMAPEQHVDISFTDARSDIFSMGAVMYRALTGVIPKELPPPPPRELNRETAPRLDHIVLKCLQEDPEDRYQSAEEFLAALEDYRSELSRAGEVCPQCKKENPITEKTCLSCGADLSEMFDACPECETENRRDVGICIGCGANLPKLRQRVADMISERRERAGKLVAEARYREALEELDPVFGVKGRLYERARSQAAAIAKECLEKCKAEFQEAIEKGNGLAERGRLDEAVVAWRAVPAPALRLLKVEERVCQTEATVAECRESVEKAARLLGEHHLRTATLLLKSVAEKWPQCPGLSDASYQLQALQQAEQMVQQEIEEADRLLAEGNYQQAREVLQNVSRSMPNHPAVQHRLELLAKKQFTDKLVALLREAKEAEEQERHLVASQRWRAAAEMLPDGSGQKAKLMARAEAERDNARSVKGTPELVPDESDKGRAGVRIRSTGRKTHLKVLLYFGAALGLIAVAAVGVFLYVSQTGHEATPPVHVVRPNKPPELPPEKPPVPGGEPEKPPARFYSENFDDGKVGNWDFEVVSGQATWQPLPVGKRPLRALASDGETAAVHKFYREKDCGVEAWVRVDAAEAGKSSIGLSVRRQGTSEILLELSPQENAFSARLVALVDGKPAGQTDAKTLPVVAGAPFEGKLRLDAIGDKAAARVDNTVVGMLSKLPAQLVQPGNASLQSAYCRASWDDVELAEAKPKNLGIFEIVKPPPVVGPVPEPKLPPLEEATPAPGVKPLALGAFSLRVMQSFDANDACWKGEAGTWQRVGGNRYGPARAETASSFLALGAFGDVDITAGVAPGGGIADSTGRAAGLYARYVDAQNCLFFGIVGVGQKGWTLQMVASKGGKKTVRAVSGGPYGIRGRDYKLRLVVVGGQACGYLEGKPMLALDDVGGAAPPSGKAGLGTLTLGAAFDSVEVKAAHVTGLGLELPEGVQAQKADPPALFKLRDTKNQYAFLENLVSQSCSMTVQVRLSDIQTYPQFSMCGAAKGQRDVMAAAQIDLAPEKRALVRLVGFLPVQGQIRSGVYAQRTLQHVNPAEPLRLKLTLKPDSIECALNDELAVAYKPGTVPLPKDPGKWGFQCTDLSAAIERIELEL